MSTVRIERNDNDPSVVEVFLVSTDGNQLEMKLSNLEPGDGDDAALLRVVAGIADGVGGSIDAVVGEAVIQGVPHG